MKVLIANRGEIAVRITRTCHEMGIDVVAVYSEADRSALHVRMADEAVAIGPAPPRESYLRVDRLIDAAKKTGCWAVHPGYGFLSENADFAQAVIDAGMLFIGPDPSAVRAMGDKTVARETMRAAGVPLVPGSPEKGRSHPSLDVARASAREVGYPIMIKAAAGGGGKGMRLVRDPARFDRDFESAKREAKSAFGDDAVYLEKFIEQPRHVEVQVFGDRQDHTVHLFERDCSIQRRHQKVIEETPSPAVTENLRQEMGAIAVRAAQAIGYVGAGTVEFLLAPDGKFYFLEMNTRLQVEHPITEWITGLDLVRWQILVAQGEPLPLTQDKIPRRGHSIEFRVYAEDPVRFLPSPGTIVTMHEPAGPGVRVDSGFTSASEVTPYYDPLISKLTVWHETRALAVDRALRALCEYQIGGIRSNLDLHRAVLRHPEFRAGRYDTSFLERYRKDLEPKPMEPTALDLAIAIAALETDRRREFRNGESPRSGLSAWRQVFSPKAR